MHLNSDSMESPDENHEMLEIENHGIAGRLADLERKVIEQGDELVCLKATLAEALRRLSQLEGGQRGSLTPVRVNGTISKPQQISRQRSISYNVTSKDSPRRQIGNSNGMNSPSGLPQRRAVHYQSTGSLHSDSHSSNSVSPVPSPSPRSTPLPLNGPGNGRRTPSGTSNLLHPSPLHKRWSSTGDFGAAQGNGMQSKFSTKSYMNLSIKSNGFLLPSQKHGTKDTTFNEEDGSLKVYLRGRPIVLHAPTEYADSYDLMKVAAPPSQRLKLDWVYGYRGRDCRSNLYFLPTGEMVYFVAAVVVLYNVEEQNQRHYLGHTDDIKSLAIHPNKLVIATGQCGGVDRNDSRPHIRIWNSVSLATQAIIGFNDFETGICCLSFSKADGGNLLVAIDESAEHSISVWDWQKGDNGYKITETKGSVDTIVSAEFHPLDRNTIVTCGKSHISFWSLDASGALYKRAGVFETRDKPKYVTAVAFLQTGETITGDSNGNLAVWGRGTNTIWKFKKGAHDGGVFSICVTKDGSVITGGGKDGRVFMFDSGLNQTEEWSQIELHYGGVRVISEGQGNQLLVGTTRNCILVGSCSLGFQPIILGHADELWGLAAHPGIQQFATAGYDKVLQLWDSPSHSILWSKDIGEQAQCATFTVDGMFVLVGCKSGKWLIYDTQTRDLVGSHVDGNETIETMRFSPDGTMLALGSRDNNIYIYQVSEDGTKYSKVGRCSGHSSFITHLDWANDGQTLRSNSGDYELLYWNAGTCRQIPQSGMMKDVEWATNNCTLTFTTVGIWPENADGSDINNCDRSNNQLLMVTGDDFGKVKLFSYPVIQPKSLCHIYGGHSSHVTSVKFLYDDTRLISIGGKDTAVLQWAIS
ncbi:echinoderm microtubule-associated protein-like 2 isoform X2 [Aethina tumida]|uniref:echinoderm microtubule-associated protein-like 2 isoform X2 n=1 Tax=Aethina tumida TaxID=116153 RepID=UPI00096B4F27|nr:echinoderm microtubule-associated protein-like 2 isoform X2 [Aethina tumida]XP_049825885.1 echinoderm microtubule-associated protein-like 2 isoform X2 [Aethina tumida]